MSARNPFLFILPGLFLFVLGIGNVSVGSHKSKEYREIITNLELRAPLSGVLLNASPLRRVKLAEKSAHRNLQRRRRARNRVAFYNLVTFGGKSLMLIGICTMLIGISMRFRGHENLHPS